jgi:hypothetical protein
MKQAVGIVMTRQVVEFHTQTIFLVVRLPKKQFINRGLKVTGLSVVLKYLTTSLLLRPQKTLPLSIFHYIWTTSGKKTISKFNCHSAFTG